MADRETALAWGPGCAVRRATELARQRGGGSSGESSPALATKTKKTTHAFRVVFFVLMPPQQRSGEGVLLPLAETIKAVARAANEEVVALGARDDPRGVDRVRESKPVGESASWDVLENPGDELAAEELSPVEIGQWRTLRARFVTHRTSLRHCHLASSPGNKRGTRELNLAP